MRLACRLFVVAAALAASAVVYAQTGSSATRRTVLKNDPRVMDGMVGCPIQFSVQHYGLVATLRETARGKADDFAQSLQLRFNARGLSRVQRVEVIVHGRSAKAEMLPLSSEPVETAAQTFRLGRSEGLFEATHLVVTHSVPLVTRLELTRVEYTDGSIWREPTAGACSVQPSPMVLVNAEVY